MADLRIPKPEIHTGPKHMTVDEATIHYLREAAERVRAARIWGSGVSALVATVLDDTAAALLASSAPATASEDATLSDSDTDSVTSSDGDRGLSDEEREAVLRAHVHISPAALFGVIERILAARTAQPEGVERVEYVAETERGRLVNFGARSWEARRFAVTQDVVLWRRTIATRRGPWEVVGDE